MLIRSHRIRYHNSSGCKVCVLENDLWIKEGIIPVIGIKMRSTPRGYIFCLGRTEKTAQTWLWNIMLHVIKHLDRAEDFLNCLFYVHLSIEVAEDTSITTVWEASVPNIIFVQFGSFEVLVWCGWKYRNWRVALNVAADRNCFTWYVKRSFEIYNGGK